MSLYNKYQAIYRNYFYKIFGLFHISYKLRFFHLDYFPHLERKKDKFN